MGSRALPTSTLLRRSASNLHLFDHGARGTLQPLALRPAHTATITSYQRVSALKPTIKAAAKPASTITKPPAKPAVKRPSTYATLSPQTSRTKGAAAAATPTSPEAVAEPVDLSSSTGVEANEIENITSAGPSNEKPDAVDWSTSFQGVGVAPFSSEASQILMADLSQQDIEIKPDGIVYLPEIKYRRILNRAFGPGGWGMVPRGDLVVEDKIVTREYALIAHGRFVAQARGECQYFSNDTITTAGEGCKSNALMRCCKDIGIASELWDPRFIRTFKKAHCAEVWVENVSTKKKRQIWMRKDNQTPTYPFALAKN